LDYVYGPGRRAMNSPAVPALTKVLLEDVKKALTNTLSPGDRLLLVDMDEWGVDVALTGSQKALSFPTGMGLVCASPRVFFDWKDYLRTYWHYDQALDLELAVEAWGLSNRYNLSLGLGLNKVAGGKVFRDVGYPVK
uniref:Serine--glyoxylate aminotransferase (Fragments) n=1 Tax=Zea mays TaxID=4577 RepID=SGAT_MAIZE|nr:RecName: Full=Serine--glyoxylate aminotransferase; Short=SGAT; AltName: Full=Alanine--glyoxylate aminotransferase; Short=AGT [Zea mays]